MPYAPVRLLRWAGTSAIAPSCYSSQLTPNACCHGTASRGAAFPSHPVPSLPPWFPPLPAHAVLPHSLPVVCRAASRYLIAADQGLDGPPASGLRPGPAGRVVWSVVVGLACGVALVSAGRRCLARQRGFLSSLTP
jgi:hypothetical protein